MDRLEVQFSQIVQTRRDTRVTVRLYRLGDAVIDAEGTVAHPRELLRTLTEVIGPVQPWGRFAELYQDRAEQLIGTFGGRPLAGVVCSL